MSEEDWPEPKPEEEENEDQLTKDKFPDFQKKREHK